MFSADSGAIAQVRACIVERIMMASDPAISQASDPSRTGLSTRLRSAGSPEALFSAQSIKDAPHVTPFRQSGGAAQSADITTTRPAPLLSVVIPVFNEEPNIEWLAIELINYLDERQWSYELMYVDDGSTDESGERIRVLAEKYPQVRYLAFSRNFGKEAATTAGIHAARGDAVILFDADGQFPFRLIEEFVQEWRAGADVVVGVRRSNQNEGSVKRYGSRIFYRLINLITREALVPGSTDFRLIDRKVVEAFKCFTERNRLTRGLIDWLGFRRVYLPFDAGARSKGKAAYNCRKLVRLAMHSFVAQSTRPLLFTGVLGMFVMAISSILGLAVVAESYLLQDPLHLGITGTAVLGIFLAFLVGVVLCCQGLLALYLESVYSETRNRPLYVLLDNDG
jgi:dolichol-phosphate mannosyltransferase